MQPFDSLPSLLNWWPPNPWKCPWGIEGRNVFSLCPFPDEFADVYQVMCQSVQQLDCFPRLLNIWPPKTTRRRKCPPGVLGSELYLAYVHSQTNSHTWTKFGANRSSRLSDCPDFWMCDSLTPPPPKWPLGYCGRILFSLCLFPDESADGYQMWCQSVQPFDSLPSILNVWPPNPWKCPLGYWGANCIQPMSIPRRIRRRVPNMVQIGPTVWQLPHTFEYLTP